MSPVIRFPILTTNMSGSIKTRPRQAKIISVRRLIARYGSFLSEFCARKSASCSWVDRICSSSLVSIYSTFIFIGFPLWPLSHLRPWRFHVCGAFCGRGAFASAALFANWCSLFAAVALFCGRGTKNNLLGLLCTSHPMSYVSILSLFCAVVNYIIEYYFCWVGFWACLCYNKNIRDYPHDPQSQDWGDIF